MAEEDISKNKVLFAFDFDHTVIDNNSDVWIMDIVHHLNFADRRRELRKQLPTWIGLMNHIMKTQHEHGCDQQDVVRSLNQIHIIETMRKILEKIRDNPLADAVIISDANTFSIKTILDNYNLMPAIKTIYSNPASFNEDGYLVVSPYHAHCCIRCRNNPNMCKGLIIHQLVTKSDYSQIVYVGDGSNDYCAAMHLSSHDHVVAREGYGLAKRIREESPPPTIDIVDFVDDKTATLLISLLPTQ